MADLAIMKKKRSHIKAGLTRFVNFIETINNDREKMKQIPTRLDKLDTIWKEFDAIQTEIEISEEAEVDGTDREDFENKFYSVITKARGIFDSLRLPDPTVQPHNIVDIHNDGLQRKIRLPTIEVPKFDGSWEKWLPFRDTFKSMVHSNNLLSDIEKLHYLKWSLTGEAHKLIEALEITLENYTTAWNLIAKRYENNKIIILQHTQSLINVPSVNKESHIELRKFINSIQQHLQTLKRLEQPVDNWSILLIQLLVPKLDNVSRRVWESERAEKEELPTLTDLLAFLERRCLVLETIQPRNSGQNQSEASASMSGTKPFRKFSSHVASQVVTGTAKCPVCDASHRIFECKYFREMTPYKRQETTKKLQLCYNCLKPYHGKQCNMGSCKKCSKHHNTLLHFESRDDESKSRDGFGSCNTVSRADKSINAIQLNQQSLASWQTRSTSTQILLSTAIVKIENQNGHNVECRALLDSGSQAHLMSKRLREQFNLDERNIIVTIMGVGQSVSKPLRQTSTKITSRLNSFTRDLQFLVMDEITSNIPDREVDITEFVIPPNIELADPNFHKPGKIDILLGADIFWQLLSIGQIRTGKSQPILQKTIFGWIVSGPSATSAEYQEPVRCNLVKTSTLEQQMERFWEIEEIKSRRILSPEEASCENHFCNTYTKNCDGRFRVELPLKRNCEHLGNSYDVAKGRFLMLEKKFSRNSDMKAQYFTFIREYLSLGHMNLVGNSDTIVGTSKVPTFYLPHHAVFKEDSTTTKIRVVFDGSAKSTSGLSLNDVLMVGPTLQEDLFSIVMRFRQHKYALSADVTKMYRQIDIAEKHKPLQRILWRFDPSEELKTYELTTVTYGLASSSFLAVRCLHQAADDASKTHPLAANSILRDFYVDDLLIFPLS